MGLAASSFASTSPTCSAFPPASASTPFPAVAVAISSAAPAAAASAADTSFAAGSRGLVATAVGSRVGRNPDC